MWHPREPGVVALAAGGLAVGQQCRRGRRAVSASAWVCLQQPIKTVSATVALRAFTAAEASSIFCNLVRTIKFGDGVWYSARDACTSHKGLRWDDNLYLFAAENVEFSANSHVHQGRASAIQVVFWGAYKIAVCCALAVDSLLCSKCPRHLLVGLCHHRPEQYVPKN